MNSAVTLLGWLTVGNLAVSLGLVVTFLVWVPWYTSFAGRLAFGFACLFAFTFLWVSFSRVLPLLWRYWAVVVTYGASFLCLTAMLIGLIVAQIRGRRKGNE